MDKNSISKFMALILRHKPEEIGITLDEHGWVDVKELIEGISKQYPFDMAVLEEIVREDKKGRYSFNEDKTKIRANQGHSINVDVELKEKKPPQFLYHGTAQKYMDSIMSQGLVPKSRLYVHLSWDEVTAKAVGSRHGKPVILKISAEEMYNKGYKFYLSENNVWLTKSVPAEMFEVLE